MSELNLCLSRREKIYNKVAANNICLKWKKEKNQFFLKNLESLRKMNKNFEIVIINIITYVEDLYTTLAILT